MALNIKGTGNQLPAAAPEPKEVVKPETTSASSLKSILAAIAKEKGDGVFSTARKIPKVERIPTGVFEVDLLTGGGFPCARYSIVYGPEASGKSNLAYCAVAQVQRMAGPCNKAVWLDIENTFDPQWAAQFGIDIDELIVVRPSYGEQAVDLLDALVRADDVKIVVVDSLAVMVGIKEIEQSAEKFDVGTSPLLIKRMVNKLVIALADEEKKNHKPAVILINQTRMKIGVMFGNPESVPGGKAQHFLSCLTLRVSGKKKIEKAIHDSMPAWMETTVEIKKSKVPVTGLKVEYDMCLYPHGGVTIGESDSWSSVANHLKEMGLLRKDGKDWKLWEFAYPTLVYFQDLYAAEPAFALRCQQAVVAAKTADAGFVHEPSPDGQSLPETPAASQ